MFDHFRQKLRAVGRTRPTPIAAGGYFWFLEPAGHALFGANGPKLDGESVVVKSNLQRTISRVALPGGTVYVKTCRANTLRSWAREVLRPAKAKLEFDNALSLARLGIATVEPLAWGSRSRTWPGESVLITRERAGAQPFEDYFGRTITTRSNRERFSVFREFGAFLAKLHEAGVTHPDPHPGNFLIEFDSANRPQFVLMDLHAIRFGEPLDWPQSRDNLTVLNRWFQLRASSADRLRFWKAYRSRRKSLSDDASPREIERATAESNNRFWTARLARYRGNNRDSHKVRGPAARGFVLRELPPKLVSSWLADPDRPFQLPNARILKDSPSSTVAEFPLEDRTVIYKRFRINTWPKLLKNALRRSQAMRSWLFGNNVRDRGLPTARPLAAFEHTRFGIPRAGYVAFEKVPDAKELDRAVAELTRWTEGERRLILENWCARIGRLLRTMHERQVSHRDLKAANILMSGTDPLAAIPVLIDLVGVEVGRAVPEAIRVRDLARLNVSFLATPIVRHRHRRQLLQTYLGPADRGEWKRWWKAIAAATREKVERNARIGRPIA